MGHREGEREEDDGARHRLRGDEGAVLVEAAFVLPILVFLVFAIYAVCTGMNAKTELTDPTSSCVDCHLKLAADVDWVYGYKDYFAARTTTTGQ